MNTTERKFVGLQALREKKKDMNVKKIITQVYGRLGLTMIEL